MADKNTISVVMCTCNGKSRHLAEQIESIFAQTLRPMEIVVQSSCTTISLRPMEIVVQDDCSTDGTLELLEAYAKKVPKGMAFRIYSNDTRLGINGNFFSAIAKAGGGT